ncbi:hypothetical protein JMUB6875_03800 [Nocardia sp. JMUB6875]
MSISMPSAVVLQNLSFEWPDGSIALAGLTGTLTAGRTGLVGRNGAGKSMLIEDLLHGRRPERAVLHTDRVGYLPQRLDNLDERASALENVHAVAVTVVTGTIRNQLARLLLRGSAVERPVSTLSGGERFQSRGQPRLSVPAPDRRRCGARARTLRPHPPTGHALAAL